MLRGLWDGGDAQALILTVKGWDFSERCPGAVTIKPIAKALPQGTWAAYVNGQLVRTEELAGKDNEGFGVQAAVKRGEEVDVVFVKV